MWEYIGVVIKKCIDEVGTNIVTTTDTVRSYVLEDETY